MACFFTDISAWFYKFTNNIVHGWNTNANFFCNFFFTLFTNKFWKSRNISVFNIFFCHLEYRQKFSCTIITFWVN